MARNPSRATRLGDILNVGIKTPVLVDDNDSGEFCGSFRPGGIGTHLALAGWVFDISGFETWIILWNNLGHGLAAFQNWQKGCGRDGPTSEHGQFLEKHRGGPDRRV